MLTPDQHLMTISFIKDLMHTLITDERSFSRVVVFTKAVDEEYIAHYLILDGKPLPEEESPPLDGESEKENDHNRDHLW